MIPIEKQIVTNEAMEPVAVIIQYADWQKIEALLQQIPAGVGEACAQRIMFPQGNHVPAVSEFVGTIELRQDPLEYQLQERGQRP